MVRSRQAAGRSLCRRDRPALRLRRAGWRRAAARAATPRRSCRRRSSSRLPPALPPRPPLFTAGGLIYEAHVRALHHAPSRHSRSAARHGRRARASGDHRASRKARRVGGRTDAGRRLDRRAASAAARADAMPGATIPSPSWRSIRGWRRAASPSCATPSRRCARPASASSSTSSSTTPARATGSARRCRCAASTHAPTTGTRPTIRACWSTTPAPATPSPATSPQAAALILDALRHFVLHAGVDGFRFDLATVLGRVGRGFDAEAPLAAGDRRRSGARRPRPDRRTLGHRAGRLPARQFPAAIPRMERPFPRRCQALLARRPRHDRRAGDAACRLVRCLPEGQARRRRARSTSSPRMTA